MITTITLNPAIDRFIMVEQLKTQSINHVLESSETAGGKGINVSKVLDFFDIPNIAIGLAGKSNYHHYKNLSTIKNMHFLKTKGYIRTNIKMYDIHNNQTTEVNEKGNGVSKQNLDKMQSIIQRFAKKSNYVVLSGSLPASVSEDYYANIIDKIKDNTCVILDTSGQGLKLGITAGVHIIKPNIHELEQAYGITFTNTKHCIDFCKELIKKHSYLSTILVTFGHDGCVLIEENTFIKLPCLQTTVINTTGAGDFFLGGYLAYKAKGYTSLECLKAATCCGALSVSQKSTEIFTTQSYQNIQQQVHNLKETYI
jgi:1-phosphofructokinase